MFSAVGLRTVAVPIDFDKDLIDSGKGYDSGYYPKDTILFAVTQPRTEIDQIVYAPFDSKSTLKETQLNDPKVDAMIAKARAEGDETQRLQDYVDVQAYIAQQVYTIPIGGQYTFTMLQPTVQNYQVGSNGGEAVETYAKVWVKQ